MRVNHKKSEQPRPGEPDANTGEPCASCRLNTACPLLTCPRAGLPCERSGTEPKARLLRARTKLAPGGRIALIREGAILSMCRPDPSIPDERVNDDG